MWVHPSNQTNNGIKVAQFVLNMTKGLTNLAFNTIPIRGVCKDALGYYEAKTRPTQSVRFGQNFQVRTALLETLRLKHSVAKTCAQTKNG